MIPPAKSARKYPRHRGEHREQSRKRIQRPVSHLFQDDTARIQVALNSGASTVYFSPGIYRIADTLRVRGRVRHLIGMEAELKPASSHTFTNPSTPKPVFRFETPDDDVPVVIFERFNLMGFGQGARCRRRLSRSGIRNGTPSHISTRSAVAQLATLDVTRCPDDMDIRAIGSVLYRCSWGAQGRTKNTDPIMPIPSDNRIVSTTVFASSRPGSYRWEHQLTAATCNRR
jgi:hypothetical protein